MQRQNESYTDTKSGKFYVSSDKENWTEVGRFSMEKILDRQVFGVTPTKGRYFKVSIEESYRVPMLLCPKYMLMLWNKQIAITDL